jgi:hypothetical protein
MQPPIVRLLRQIVQAPLFELPEPRLARSRRGVATLDAAFEGLLNRFRERRLATGANPRTVAKEVSQLRSLAHCESAGTADSPTTRFSTPEALAKALLEPGTTIARSTGRARLVAAQRFLRLCSAELGIDDSTWFVDVLDQLLPQGPRQGWHSAGTLVVNADGQVNRDPT